MTLYHIWDHVSLFHPSKPERGISLMLLLLLLDKEVQTTTQSTTNSEAKDHALQVVQEDVAVMGVAIIIGGDILDKVVQLLSPSMVDHTMKCHHLPLPPTVALVFTMPSHHQCGHCTTSPIFSPTYIPCIPTSLITSSLSSKLTTHILTVSMTIQSHLQTLGMMLLILFTRMLMSLALSLMLINLLLLPSLFLECFCTKRSILISNPTKQGVGGVSLIRNYPEGKFQIRL